MIGMARNSFGSTANSFLQHDQSVQKVGGFHQRNHSVSGCMSKHQINTAVALKIYTHKQGSLDLSPAKRLRNMYRFSSPGVDGAASPPDLIGE